MMAAPWLFGFRKNRSATINSVASGAAILGLSLMTRYPLGAAKLIPFPVHGAIETAAGVATSAAPWLMGFSRNDRARWTHLVSGLSTLAVVAMTDYRAQERRGQQISSGRGAGLAEQIKNLPEKQQETVDLGPPTRFPEGVLE